jgi:hypothetical protein
MNNIHFVKVQEKEKILAVKAIDEVLDLLSRKDTKLGKLFRNTTITVGNNLINSGGSANAEKMEIILDASKNSMSLKNAESYLVSEKILNKGDWTKVVSQSTKPWSCLVYQLIHEFGHIVDGKSHGNCYKRVEVKVSPTKYGLQNKSEAFAELFTYWIFGIRLDKNLESIVDKVVSRVNFAH